MPVPNGVAVDLPPPTYSNVKKSSKQQQQNSDSKPIPMRSGLTSRASLNSLHVPTELMRPEETSGWDKPIEFIFTCISYAVGLGNVWRFPYLCYENGGGAFLLPYCIMLVIVGMPIFFLELSFGQFASRGPIVIWTINPLFKGLGYAMVSVTFVIAFYYNVIIAQCLLYFGMSMNTKLPWDSCGNWWNTGNCTVPEPRSLNGSSTLTSYANLTDRIGQLAGGEPAIIGTNTEEFYYNYVLHQSPYGINDMGMPQWRMAICLLVSWAIVAAGLIKGIKSLGKISYFTALFPYAMLTVLLIRGVTLPGAINGIAYYVTPKWDKLLEISVWSKAANQIFYNLSCATGGLIAMASFNKFKNNCLRDALIVPVLNAFTSIFAGLVVFSILGFMAYEKGTTVDKVASDGPGLVFIVYPEALSKLPIAPLWSILFFLMMLTLGFGSELSLVETVLTAFQDDLYEYLNTNTKKIVYRVMYCVVCCLFGLTMVCRGGIYVLDLLDSFISFIALIVVCLVELIVLAWIYGYPKFFFCDDLKMMLDKEVPMFFKIMWRFVTPISLLFLLIAGIIQYTPPEMKIVGFTAPLPTWALTVGWIVGIFPILLIPAWMLVYTYFYGGFRGLSGELKPMANWGPRNIEHHTGRYTKAGELKMELRRLESATSMEKGASWTYAISS